MKALKHFVYLAQHRGIGLRGIHKQQHLPVAVKTAQKFRCCRCEAVRTRLRRIEFHAQFRQRKERNYRDSRRRTRQHEDERLDPPANATNPCSSCPIADTLDRYGCRRQCHRGDGEKIHHRRAIKEPEREALQPPQRIGGRGGRRKLNGNGAHEHPRANYQRKPCKEPAEKGHRLT